MCESCDVRVASYWIDFRRRDVEPFAVCRACMANARYSPTPPLVTVIGGAA